MKTQPRRLLASLLAAGILAPLAATSSHAAKFSSAAVSRKINLVELLLPDGDKRAADIGSTVSGSTAVQTGNRSRAELMFPDESVIRLGSDSVFSFTAGERDVQLDQGTMLMQSKRFRGKTSIRTAAITAAITGTTIMIEYIPPVLNAAGKVTKPGVIKIIVVEGTLEFALNIDPGKTMRLGAGEMVILSTEAKQLPKKFIIDLSRLTKTSKLMAGGLGPLPKQDQINRAVMAQQRDKSTAQLVAVSTREPFSNRSLTRDARTAVNGRPPVMPVLQAFIRRPSKDNDPPDRPAAPVKPIKQIKPIKPIKPIDPNCVDISGPPPPNCVRD